MTESLVGCLLLILLSVCLWLPAWWLAGRMDERLRQSLVRVPVSAGMALVGYLSFVNLFGSLLENSLQAVFLYLALNLVACAVLLWKHRAELDVSNIWRGRKSWALIVLVAILLAVPQWFHAVSGNRWDEMASSSIHITAPNQFAEGEFPPRHNAFPDIVAKYHYGFTLLSGTVHWLTRLTANVSIDIASTALWLFTFLLTFGWMRQLAMSRMASVWGGFAVLLGGGLSWLYLPWLRVYEGFKKFPPESALVHSYNSSESWWSNLLTVMENQNVHLANSSGDIFSLPFDVAIHYQQHSVAMGIALTLVAAYLFWLWQTRKDFAPVLLGLNVLSFGLVFLGHAVFGSVASASAGLALLALWLRAPTRIRFFQGILFTLGVTFIAFLHGGMLASGEEYGPPGAPVALRDSFGYIDGSLFDWINWSLAGFGLLLVLAVAALGLWLRQRNAGEGRNAFVVFFGFFALISFVIPQLFFFSHAGGSEEQTEIVKFFFCTHLGLALLSVVCIDYLARRWTNWVVVPLFVLTAISPLAASVAASLNEQGSWAGFYKSPYDWGGGNDNKAAGEALRALKKSSRDQYYDFSTREASSGFLNELLVYGGSAFSLTPTRYETTGFGFLIAEDRVASRLQLQSRMAKLLPDAAENSGIQWLYTSSRSDLAQRPVVVRSRFAKMVAEGILARQFISGPRELFEFASCSSGVDRGIEEYWSPKVITQAHSDWDGDGKIDLLFFNYRDKAITLGDETVAALGDSIAHSEFPIVYLARFPGDARSDVLVGHMADALYRRGETVSAMIQQYQFLWQRRDSESGQWQARYQHGFWMTPLDLPFVADHDHDGFDSQLLYRPKTGQWFLYPNQNIEGPTLPESADPLPLAGRFLEGSSGDLAVWSPIDGQFKVRSLSGDASAEMVWGSREGDILLPGDYDGDGYDEVGIWQPHSNTWWIRNMPSGPNLKSKFGTASGIPLPADYDGDGKLDLAYWEPRKNKIYVSFDFGGSVGQTISVPPDSVPIFVQMY